MDQGELSLKTALVIGGASCVWDDLNCASRLGCEFDLIIVVNDIGIDWNNRIDAWCSYHSDLLQVWTEKRERLKLPRAGELWCGPVKPRHIKIPMQCLRTKGGSSGMLGAFIALEKKADKIVLCGIPLDPNMNHFNNKQHGKPWKDGKHYQKHWRENLPALQDKVKSFRGFTGKLLGAPTPDWIKS